jgi:hypothetical protein
MREIWDACTNLLINVFIIADFIIADRHRHASSTLTSPWVWLWPVDVHPRGLKKIK